MKPEQPLPDHYDVVIAGGAMAGATLALAIDTLGGGRLSIAVIEAAIPDHDTHPGYDARSIALAYGTCRQLETFGLWDSLSPFATAINKIHVSDRGHFGLAAMDADDEGLPFLGNVIELADAGRVFHRALASNNRISLFCPASVAGIVRQQDSTTVTLNDGRTLQTRLLVAADGAVSSCCQALGITRHQHDFGQVAIIANVSTALPHNGQAFERFTESGPVALLPMSEGRSSLVWCVDPAQAEQIQKLSGEAFLTKLQDVFGWRLGALTHVGSRYAYPLILRQSERLISHRFAIVGNAAQTLHPIAGQGFNLGIRDVTSLAEEIVAANTAGRDIGEMSVLQGYQTRRQNDRDNTVKMTAGLVHTFSNNAAALILARNLGLVAMGCSPALKAPLLKRAMGLVKR